MTALLPLADRMVAGRLLARQLMHFKNRDALVLALPRGGVPVAFEIARALDAELDLLLVRKIGAPGNPEYGVGAIVDGDPPQVVMTEESDAILGAEPGYFEHEKARQLAELGRRREAYLGQRPRPRIAGRTVIIVDDGVATGATMMAAIRGIRQKKPAWLVLAVPVAPPDLARRLAILCDEFIVLATPKPFLSVGQHYRDFSQTPDAQVIRLLAEARGGAD